MLLFVLNYRVVVAMADAYFDRDNITARRWFLVDAIYLNENCVTGD